MSRVLLSDVDKLAFFADSFTKGRRTAPIPQLQCEGRICKQYHPTAVSCENFGGSGADITWKVCTAKSTLVWIIIIIFILKCSADLPDTLRFGKIDVSCEGWSRPGDPYVLSGSELMIASIWTGLISVFRIVRFDI